MDKYPHSLSIQRTGCHSISNIAMDLDNAAMLMNKVNFFEFMITSVSWYIIQWGGGEVRLPMLICGQNQKCPFF